MLAGLLRKPFHQERGQLIEQTVPDMAIDVLGQIFDDDLAAKLLAEKLTLDPTTGPRSRSTGCDRELKPAMKRASTLVGCTGASEAPTSDSACSLRRRENRSESATDLGELRSLETLAQIQRSQLGAR